MNQEGIGDNHSAVFFRESTKILHICGLWQDCNHLNVRRKNKTGALILIVFGIGTSSAGFSGYLDFKINGDLVDSQKSLILSVGTLLCTVKLYTFWSSVGEIKQCLGWLQTFSGCFDNHTFIKHALKLYRIFFIIGETIMVLTAITFFCVPVLENTRMLPLATKNPIQIVDILKSPTYEIFYFYQIVALTTLAVCMVACDTLFCGILLIIAAFLKTINALFKETFLKGSAKNKGDKENEKVMIQIIEYFIETTRIIDFVQEVFSLMSFSSLFFNMIEMGLALYMTSVLPFNSPSFWCMGLILLFEIFQLGIYCFFGETIVTQNTIFRYNIYQCDWYNQSRAFKIMILLTLQRTENEPFIICGKLVPLCNETFAEILKMAYSMCTFLYSFRENYNKEVSYQTLI